MMTTIGFGFVLIGLLILIKYFDQQRDYFSINHNLFNQDFRPKPMGSVRCSDIEQYGKTVKSRGQLCTSTFVPKTDEDRSQEIYQSISESQ